MGRQTPLFIFINTSLAIEISLSINTFCVKFQEKIMRKLLSSTMLLVYLALPVHTFMHSDHMHCTSHFSHRHEVSSTTEISKIFSDETHQDCYLCLSNQVKYQLLSQEWPISRETYTAFNFSAAKKSNLSTHSSFYQQTRAPPAC